MPSIFNRQFSRWYRCGSRSASTMSVYSRNKWPHLPNPSPTSRMERGLIWRTRWMTVGIALGLLLGILRSQFEHNQPLILDQTGEGCAKIRAKSGVMIEPPEAVRGEDNKAGSGLS